MLDEALILKILLRVWIDKFILPELRLSGALQAFWFAACIESNSSESIDERSKNMVCR